MTVQRTGCAARLLYRDRHLCVGSWYTVTTPDGETYELCSGACLVSFAIYGALPADIGGAQGDTSTRVGEAA